MKSAFLALVSIGALFASDPALDRLKRAAGAVKILNEDGEHKDQSALLASLHSALEAWIETRLPHGEAVTPGKSAAFESVLKEELNQAGLIAPEQPPDNDALEWPGLGYVGVEFKWLPELIGTAFVIAQVSVPCGSDDAVYAYDFRGPRWIRIFADGPRDGWGRTGTEFQISDPDRDGRRLLLIHYASAQCASTWMGMTYSVRRLSVDGDRAEPILSTDHGFWLGNDGPEFTLKPEELIVEFLDGSVDPGIHNRTQIDRYNFEHGVRRLDPVAFQPQDFVEEWLTRPWSEMESRSQAGVKPWHDQLSNDLVLGDYAGVIPCAALPNRWLIDLEITHIGKELDKSIEAFFLVRDQGGYHYTMDAVSADRPEACPGTGIVSGAGLASDKHPWLSTAELKAIP
jgi:hypothetical protein